MWEIEGGMVMEGGTGGGQESLVLLVVVLGSIEVVVWEGEEGAEEGDGW